MNQKRKTEKTVSHRLRVVFVGAGNVAAHLSAAMQRAGHDVVQVYSRTDVHARTLANRLQTEWTADLKTLVRDAGLYVFCVSDDALPDVIAAVRPNGALWIHTAGSVPLDVFGRHVERGGVLYPLQTFSKAREVDFARVPCFVEARLPQDEVLLCRIAGEISGDVRALASYQRKRLHLAAVFACNFTNHMYAIAAKTLEREGLPWEILLPLIDATAAGVHTLAPSQAQTGPAARGDRRVMDMQAELTADADVKRIYQLISDHIYKESYTQRINT
ncbi:MAG: DUF2520 domain-containing protein [Tannerella sp.]|jgi:predicted short-subunit dehydrogenase-like oxidoreductase (DUF2520 family)|nr:DUF2520 domain-containing protein [Tannerella sp.]